LALLHSGRLLGGIRGIEKLLHHMLMLLEIEVVAV
jgi:hypothetical protein